MTRRLEEGTTEQDAAEEYEELKVHEDLEHYDANTELRCVISEDTLKRDQANGLSEIQKMSVNNSTSCQIEVPSRIEKQIYGDISPKSIDPKALTFIEPGTLHDTLEFFDPNQFYPTALSS